ncbi:MAG: hypothetical protein ACYSWO_30475 [Planctomycetota bacterium]|jgi:hypothetical protein
MYLGTIVDADCDVCSRCGSRHDYDVEFDLCVYCRDEEYTICADCGKWVERADCYPLDDICESCFRSDIVGHISCFVSDDSEDGRTWAEWADWADKVKNTDFHCDFDCDGKCAGRRDDNGYGERGCCNGCAHNIGYLQAVPAGAVETIKALWDNNAGFWTCNGCALPHEYRSRTCLSYQCGIAARNGGEVSVDFS